MSLIFSPYADEMYWTFYQEHTEHQRTVWGNSSIQKT